MEPPVIHSYLNKTFYQNILVMIILHHKIIFKKRKLFAWGNSYPSYILSYFLSFHFSTFVDNNCTIFTHMNIYFSLVFFSSNFTIIGVFVNGSNLRKSGHIEKLSSYTTRNRRFALFDFFSSQNLWFIVLFYIKKTFSPQKISQRKKLCLNRVVVD